MNRGNNAKLRAAFCKNALNDQKAAAKELKDMAKGLEHCRNTDDVVNALSQIFACSERTIYRDLIS